jgi:hypothetical protein
MTAVDPPIYTIEVTSVDEFGQPKQTYGHCDFPDMIWAILTLVVSNLTIILLATCEAWQARNLSTEFAESQYIFQALTSMALVVSIGAPVLVLARDNPTASHFVSSGMIFISTGAILSLIFVPKIRYERQRVRNASSTKRHNTVQITGLTNTNDNTTNGTESHQEGGYGSPLHDHTDDENRISFLASSSLHLEGEDPDHSTGERILTTKTQKQLLEENAILKRLLQKARRELTAATKQRKENEKEENESTGGMMDGSMMCSLQDGNDRNTNNHTTTNNKNKDMYASGGDGATVTVTTETIKSTEVGCSSPTKVLEL